MLFISCPQDTILKSSTVPQGAGRPRAQAEGRPAAVGYDAPWLHSRAPGDLPSSLF